MGFAKSCILAEGMQDDARNTRNENIFLIKLEDGMRNRFMALALVAVLALSLSGLVAAQDKTKVRVWTGSSNPTEDKFKQDVVAAFMKAVDPSASVRLPVAL